MAIRIVADDRVITFVSNNLGASFLPPFTCMGIEKDGDVIAGVVFNFFETSDVQLTVAGHGWTRGFMRSIGNYVFETLKLERFTLMTEQPSVARLGQRLGGEIEGLARNKYGIGRDAYLIGVLKDEYRFK